ncbi:MAG TPA: hypothetical protein VFU55_04235 [Terracidiphilus sp.]|nr:hypothetical protein [Terracidiphilus sp.]
MQSSERVRGTQTLVDQMGWVIKRPMLTLLEIGWRWLFGIPFVWCCWRQWQQILTVLPPDSVGYNLVDFMNPWIAVVQLGGIWDQYEPHVMAVLVWLAPLALVAWPIVAGIGRSVVLRRLQPGVRFKPLSMMVLQGAWLLLLGLTFWVWERGIHWIAANYIAPNGEANLVGYSVWAIFLSLGMFSLWAVISWPVTIAPFLVLLEGRSAVDALRESLRLGRMFTSKLMEINLVMGITKMMIIVLAMVFAAAPLPFSDQLGPGMLKVISAGSVVFYLVANDYFQVVRLKSFLEFWRTYRESYGELPRLS